MFQGAIDWLDRIGPRVYTAFVEGDRWKLYLKGLGLTLEMTVVALCFLQNNFFGTITCQEKFLQFLISLSRTAKIKKIIILR